MLLPAACTELMTAAWQKMQAVVNMQSQLDFDC